MGPLMYAALPAGIQALGGLIGGSQQNEANAKQARLNREFQERMSNTAYQRATKDMLAAGLNPALAYQQGGASSPGGATSAPMQNVLGNATSSAVNAAQQGVAIQQARAAAAQTIEQTRGIRLENDMRISWSKYEMAARLAEIISRRSTAEAKGGRLEDPATGRSFANEAYINRIVAQMEADLKLTQTQARQGAADANVKELLNRPMLKKGYEYIKGRLSPMFKSGAYQQYMQSKTSSPWQKGKTSGGGTSW